jgi:antitoxin component YwqK of YwqJK toxin-antitoxin module
MRSAPAVAVSLLAFLDQGGPGAGMVIAKGAPGVAEVNGVLLHGGEPFSGVVVEQEGGRLLSRTPYRDGKEHGVAEAFYPQGGLRYRKLYRSGRREGTHHGFWPSGQAQFIRRYNRDLLDGEQAAFFETGMPAELREYRDGREEGRQRWYDRRGALVSNYTFKNGRRYGIVGRFDCISVGHP